MLRGSFPPRSCLQIEVAISVPRGPTDKASARNEHAQFLLLLVRPTDREAGAAASPTRTVHHRGAPRGSPTIAMGLDDGRSGHRVEKLDTVASKPTERPSQRDAGGAQLGAAGEGGQEVLEVQTGLAEVRAVQPWPPPLHRATSDPGHSV
jgi:hypothetical protein